ncbi:Signal transduction histidine kinase [Halanaeroarchaeum sp. HSR-CO]|uniref:sensor histidine kinase n=1 Tax=Halanaeroarchaeum sp. HSR-CO TaxID=2866382 RepID=UPI00217DB6B5|nr:HAMP domain-containing sensor histidine kinase [Halanaeroarchaeum sp. HSR-CO]UWG48044.1 Signal transduction histidine kinase [Halanaeroarchaeum sp. HSR-CO]
MGRATLLDESIDSPHLELLLEALDRIEEIVENTLTLARDGETVSDFAPVELADIAGRCWGMVETAGASLSIEGTGTIHGDVDRLNHLFENFFRNAEEHGATNTLMESEHGVEADRSPVTVWVGLLEEGGFYVADDGPGIPEQLRESIFDPGYTSSAEGTGFGLAICRRIVEAPGWAIRVTESDTGGARFEITGIERAD